MRIVRFVLCIVCNRVCFRVAALLLNHRGGERARMKWVTAHGFFLFLAAPTS